MDPSVLVSSLLPSHLPKSHDEQPDNDAQEE